MTAQIIRLADRMKQPVALLEDAGEELQWAVAWLGEETKILSRLADAYEKKPTAAGRLHLVRALDRIAGNVADARQAL